MINVNRGRTMLDLTEMLTWCPAALIAILFVTTDNKLHFDRPCLWVYLRTTQNTTEKDKTGYSYQYKSLPMKV